MASNPTKYDLLGLTASATPEQIRSASRKRLAEVHPDNQSGNVKGNVDLFVQVSDATKTLSDPYKRAMYDATLTQTRPKRDRPQSTTRLSFRITDLLGTTPRAFGAILASVTVTCLTTKRLSVPFCLPWNLLPAHIIVSAHILVRLWRRRPTHAILATLISGHPVGLLVWITAHYAATRTVPPNK